MKKVKLILSDKRDVNKLEVWANRDLGQFVEEKCHVLLKCIVQLMTGLTWTGPECCGDFPNCCTLKDKLLCPENDHE